MMTDIQTTIEAAVSRFGGQATPKLAGPGAPEANLRAPLETLLTTFGIALGREVVMHDEDSLSDIGARPDWSVYADGSLIGHLELKAPGTGVDTATFGGHNRAQWEKLKSLPNVLYTDGNQWAVYRYGERSGDIAYLQGDVRSSGSNLDVSDGHLVSVLTDFLTWTPIAPRSAKQLATTTAQLCRLLRNEVAEALVQSPAMRRIADDWRQLLFPDASDAQFADGYAQTVTFALLLARSEGIDFEQNSVGTIATRLGSSHSLIGKALYVLTDESLFKNMATSLTTLHRVVGAVDWAKLRAATQEARAAKTGRKSRGTESEWLHFYEHFLSVYDPALRQQTGSYYTPNEVVGFMVRMTDDLIRTRLKRKRGLATRNATIVDPAVGTGTFLLQIIEHVADRAEQEEGPGAVRAILEQLPKRLVGFEKQIGPFAVAQLRVHELIRAEIEDRTGQMAMDVDVKSRLYVTDTLDDPYVEEAHLGGLYDPIARSRRAANEVKKNEDVLVVIGNPPYKDKAGGHGGWVENGRGDDAKVLMDDFAPPSEWGIGPHTKHLKNLNIYFWRWATWKVFEAHVDSPAGVVAFITTKAFVDGLGFAAMRQHMREVADDIYVVDVSPEGHRPDVPTRLFPGVQQPLAITFLARNREPDPKTMARVHYTSVSGRREDKFRALDKLKISSRNVWDVGPDDWRAPFLPKAADWLAMPTVSDLFPWNVSGIMPGRTWVYAPTPDVLRRRWEYFTSVPVGGDSPAERAENAQRRRDLFREHRRDRPITKVLRDNVYGYPATDVPIGAETGSCPDPVPVSFRTLDRQWLIPDKRLINQPNPSLWSTHSEAQVYLTTRSDGATKSGPPLTFAAELPDLHHHRNRGGRAHPLWRNRAANVPNVTQGLTNLLTDRLGVAVTAEDVFAYVAAIVSHAGYTSRFADELGAGTTEPRIPLTADPDLWVEAVRLGRKVVWTQTYGARFEEHVDGRDGELYRLPEHRRPKVMLGIRTDEAGMPDEINWTVDDDDPDLGTLHVGEGQIRPVSRAAWEYDVGDYYLIRRWFSYRSKNPGGKRDSELDHIVARTWTAGQTTELLELINAVEHLVELGTIQDALLTRILNGDADRITVEALSDAGLLPVAAEADSPVLPDSATRLPT